MTDGFIKVSACSPKIKVADVSYNESAILEQIAVASNQGASIIVFPQLCLSGSTCGDIFFSDTLLDECERAICRIADSTKELNSLIAVGMPLRAKGKLYDGVMVLSKGEMIAFVPRTMQDDRLSRWFSCYNGRFEAITISDRASLMMQTVFECEKLGSLKIGFEVGSDASVMSGVASSLVSLGATVICNCASMPQLVSVSDTVRQHAVVVSKELMCSYVYVSGSEGESTTDSVYGATRRICESGRIIEEYEGFEAGVTTTELDLGVAVMTRRASKLFSVGNSEDAGIFPTLFDLDIEKTELTRKIAKNPFVPTDAALIKKRCEETFEIQARGLKKRIEHTSAKSLVIGISGGLDSALALLVCVKAVELLGMSRSDIKAITMPCFGTTKRTRSNAQIICEELGVDFREVSIAESVKQHFADISHDIGNHNVVFENAQARERTQVLMDIANAENGFVVGTGDLSELALGWATYNGDHMSMYGVNATVPKTLVREVVREYAGRFGTEALQKAFIDIIDTPVSPELLPTNESADTMTQKTEDFVGPYKLHDFFLYYAVRYSYSPKKIYRMACYVFKNDYDNATILKWLTTFFRRFFAQQFKRSCLTDGAKTGSVSLSPRGDLSMPSDACFAVWQKELSELN